MSMDIEGKNLEGIAYKMRSINDKTKMPPSGTAKATALEALSSLWLVELPGGMYFMGLVCDDVLALKF